MPELASQVGLGFEIKLDERFPMNMNSESQDVMLMTQETVMFLLDLELKYFPGRILAQQHISHPLLDEMLNWGLISSYSLRKFCLER